MTVKDYPIGEAMISHSGLSRALDFLMVRRASAKKTAGAVGTTCGAAAAVSPAATHPRTLSCQLFGCPEFDELAAETKENIAWCG